MNLLVPGFKGSAVSANIKYQGRLDLGLIASNESAALAAVFTGNEIKAAPVLAGLDRLSRGEPYARAVVVNSGNANACTGHDGVVHVQEICSLVAKEMGITPEDVMVSSTGVIGQLLPMGRITEAVPALVRGLSENGLEAVADAILTTDKVRKTVIRHIDVGGVEVTVAGMAKGAGMIGPNMGPPQATMLSFVLSDAKVDPVWWQGLLERTVSDTFNQITIDGDTSTNDTVLALANGLAGNKKINDVQYGEPFEHVFKELLQDLARQIVMDGEGVTKCVTLAVKGARTGEEADRIARIIAESPLVKTAFFGEDPNWGRILAAAGRAGFPLDQGLISLSFDDIEIVRMGMGLGKKAENQAKKVMAAGEFKVVLDLGLGQEEASILTSDLSTDYVRINADYRT
ncbi:MAG: bifunctional glutamate N-acetyltransferase/amino-acid acetyltransferase ArgJ [Deltaproteobacteria bacterium]|nr:bifunctional glutamate N-acetyltransferase/amino-acid acetyltransferase ArgJ [Deltaproteobacteria bacterium]MBW1937594.1 bifunctional glutamate N-acetyltransferase/amino-acid acetyltransferase ArgJ [Deltaproteobacteria bacterium]MBW1965029.1 bifunctional glutamate N-acetyltransferase/amino-acid acetyltransferase ArgJ [Deltaproteobacteria bacterium]MBW2080549.1 bifunctional glutamate N-acetyltransferase/amino-acid acetyltransferase ArgJ [Deltaproteobacteria bacterium]MBW2350755.1 bifunctional